MKIVKHHGGWVIVLSLLVALMLAQLPMPAWAALGRPAWVTLVLIYWCMALPQRIGIAAAWTTGLVLDVLSLKNALLGQYALSLSVVAFITSRFHHQLRVMPLWQQEIAIFTLVFLYQLIVLWIYAIQGRPTPLLAFWLSPLTSTLLWPWVFIILRDTRRKYRVF
jgi:rod shape-determining protein MreD